MFVAYFSHSHNNAHFRWSLITINPQHLCDSSDYTVNSVERLDVTTHPDQNVLHIKRSGDDCYLF